MLQEWSSLQPIVAETRQLSLSLDLPTEFGRLQQGNIILRGLGNRNIDHRSGMEGRRRTLYIVVDTENVTGNSWVIN